jgi:hypothetical protein
MREGCFLRPQHAMEAWTKATEAKKGSEFRVVFRPHLFRARRASSWFPEPPQCISTSKFYVALRRGHFGFDFLIGGVFFCIRSCELLSAAHLLLYSIVLCTSRFLSETRNNCRWDRNEEHKKTTWYLIIELNFLTVPCLRQQVHMCPRI